MKHLPYLLAVATLAVAVPLFGAAAPVDRTLKHEFLIGVSQHYAFDEGPIDETLSLMKQAGFNSWRSDLRWPSWYRKNGLVRPDCIYRAAKKSKEMGITPILNLFESSPAIGYHFPVGEYRQPFIDFCVAAIRAMEGTTPILQLWNEWDGGCMMHVGVGKENTVDNYIALIKAAEPEIRKAAPDAVLIANSCCTTDKYLFELFQKGMLNYCDAFSFHPYNIGATPEEVYARMTNIAKESARYNHGVSKPFYVTEIGWHSSAECLSDRVQGDYVARFLLLMKTIPTCRGVNWYSMQERGVEPNIPARYWGVMNYDYTPKDGFMTMTSVAPVVRQGSFVKRLDARDPDVWAMLYQMKDGRYVLAAWHNKPHDRTQIVLNRNGSKTGELTFEVCGGKSYHRRWGFLDQKPFVTPNPQVKEDPELFSFFCTSRPVLLYGVPANVSIESATYRRHPEPVDKVPLMPRAAATVQPRSGLLLNVSGDGSFRKLTGADYGGAKDLSFSARLTYDRNALKVHVTVDDDHFVPVDNGGRYWEGDSVQLGFCSVGEDGSLSKKFHEYTLAAQPAGPRFITRYGNTFNVPTQATLGTRQWSPTRVVYTFTVPWRELGVKLDDLLDGKAPLLFSILVNDNDGQGRKGFLHWGDGLADKKPAFFGWLFFEKNEALKSNEKSIQLGEPGSKTGWRAYPKKECEAKLAETTVLNRPALLLEGYFPAAKVGKNHMSVVLSRPVPQQNLGKFKELRIDLYSPTEPYVLISLIDATGQHFSRAVRIPSNKDWQTVVCTLNPHDPNLAKPAHSFGGANDKVFHHPLKHVLLHVDWTYRGPHPDFGVRGQICFGKIEVVTGK